jgi:hypothetical protein
MMSTHFVTITGRSTSRDTDYAGRLAADCDELNGKSCLVLGRKSKDSSFQDQIVAVTGDSFFGEDQRVLTPPRFTH